MCFPDAKFVLVSRNPYALCYGRTLSDSKDDLKARCNHWFNTFNLAMNDLSDVDYFFVRFEDFLENPSLELNSLLSYLELSEQKNLLPSPEQIMPIGGISREKWYPLQKDPNAKYLSSLSQNPDLIQIMTSVLEPLASAFGYRP